MNMEYIIGYFVVGLVVMLGIYFYELQSSKWHIELELDPKPMRALIFWLFWPWGVIFYIYQEWEDDNANR